MTMILLPDLNSLWAIHSPCILFACSLFLFVHLLSCHPYQLEGLIPYCIKISFRSMYSTSYSSSNISKFMYPVLVITVGIWPCISQKETSGGGGGVGNPCILGYRMCHFLGYFFGLKISLVKWKDSCELNFWAGFSCKNYTLGYQIKSQNGTLPFVHRLTVPPPSPPRRQSNVPGVSKTVCKVNQAYLEIGKVNQ